MGLPLLRKVGHGTNGDEPEQIQPAVRDRSWSAFSGCYDPHAMAADAMIPLLRFRATVLFVATLLITGYGSQSSPANRPWPPGIQKVPDDSPPLSPADALKTFYMPPGYHVELVASEPLIQDPVAIDWDTEGRLWAVEMPGFMADITGSNEHDPIGRVVVLEDTNADGVMDKRTVFADGLVLARSLKILDRGVLVAEPPNVWLMHDTNGDLRMDTKELVTDQFGRRDADPENNANSVLLGARQPDVHVRPDDNPVPAQGRRVPDGEDAGAWRVGRRAG